MVLIAFLLKKKGKFFLSIKFSTVYFNGELHIVISEKYSSLLLTVMLTAFLFLKFILETLL